MITDIFPSRLWSFTSPTSHVHTSFSSVSFNTSPQRHTSYPGPGSRPDLSHWWRPVAHDGFIIVFQTVVVVVIHPANRSLQHNRMELCLGKANRVSPRKMFPPTRFKPPRCPSPTPPCSRKGGKEQVGAIFSRAMVRPQNDAAEE